LCTRHSFIVTRAGKVFDGLGITDSHTVIRELCGLHANDDTVNAYEWQPPKGWPKSDWEDGLTKDTEVFELKSSHLSAMKRHIKNTYPNMDAWNTPDHFRIIAPDDLRARGWIDVDGFSEDSLSPKKGDYLFSTEGTQTVSGQTGGYCWAFNNATQTVSGQTGGDCRVFNNATQTVSGQTGGYCWAYNNATQTVSGQTGGDC
jgi:hypothetical protein